MDMLELADKLESLPASTDAVGAHTAADNVAMLRTLRRFPAGRTDRDGSLVSVTLPVIGNQPAANETPATFG